MTTVDGWQTSPLGVVANVVMGQSPDSNFYSSDEIGLPFLQGCAEFGDHNPHAILYCGQRKKVAAKDAILFSVRAPVGRQNIADRDYIIGRGLAAISATRVEQDFLAQV